MLVYIALSLIATFSARAQISLCELLADRQQFLPTFCARFWKSHFESFECVEDNSGYDEPSVLFVVGGDHIPGCVSGACRAEASFIGALVLPPEFSFGNVRNDGRPSVSCLIHDISYAGARIVILDSIDIPNEVKLCIPEKNRIMHAVVRWR